MRTNQACAISLTTLQYNVQLKKKKKTHIFLLYTTQTGGVWRPVRLQQCSKPASCSYGLTSYQSAHHMVTVSGVTVQNAWFQFDSSIRVNVIRLI